MSNAERRVSNGFAAGMHCRKILCALCALLRLFLQLLDSVGSCRLCSATVALRGTTAISLGNQFGPSIPLFTGLRFEQSRRLVCRRQGNGRVALPWTRLAVDIEGPWNQFDFMPKEIERHRTRQIRQVFKLHFAKRHGLLRK